MNEEDLEAVAGLLEDEHARSILRYTSEKPLSANELAERCEVSEATAYRRLNQLEQYELVEGYNELNPDGHHYEVYAATLDEVTIRLDDGKFRLLLNRTSDPADRMTDFLNELK